MAVETGNAIESLTQQLRVFVAGGEKLPPERVLAERFGVNRYVLRKALELLRTSDELPGIASRRKSPRPRTSIRNIADVSSPAECWEVRLLLEPEVARLAAVRGTISEIQAIEQIHARSDAAVFDLETDIEFHRAVAVASHNMLARYFIEQVMEITRDPGFRSKFPAFTAETGWRHHEMIVDAIKNRRASDAENAMRMHLTAILRWLHGIGEEDLLQLK